MLGVNDSNQDNEATMPSNDVIVMCCVNATNHETRMLEKKGKKTDSVKFSTNSYTPETEDDGKW